MKKTLNYYFTVILISLLSCQSNRSDMEFEINLSEGNPLVLDSEIVIFQISETLLEHYKIFSFDTTNQTLNLVGYNSKRHSIDFIDLLNETTLGRESIKLDNEGPNGMNGVEGILYENEQIHLVTRGKIHIINDSGGIKKSFKIDQANFQFITNEGLSFFKNNSNYILGVHDYSVSKTSNPEKYYRTSILGSFNSIDNTSETFNISYSQLHQQANYGFMDVPNINLIKNQFLITYPIDNRVYKYSIQGELLSIFNAQPIKGKSQVTPLEISKNTDASLEHYMRSNSFHKPFILGNYIVRPYRDNIPAHQSDISYPLRKKDIYISFINPNLNTIYDYKLKENNVNLNAGFVYKNTLWFQFFTEEEGLLKFLKITLSDEKQE